jgi:nucleoid-associated protein YgaU
MADQPSTQANTPSGGSSPGGKKQGLMTGKYKWWVVGGLGLVAVLVFFFVSKSSSNSSGTPSGGVSTTAMDPSTQAALQSALQGQSAAGYAYQAATGPQGVQGPAGPAGPAGAKGPAGPKGGTGAAGKPAPKPASGHPQTQYYTVRAGDSLSKIASQFHISGGWQSLYSANRSAVGSNPNLIHPGLRLKVK